MAFSIFKVLKGLLITEENTLTPKEIEIVPGGTASTKTVIQSSQTTNKTITLPDATDTLVGKATTDVLTNKSIDADTNTITNIEDADIKALAAIDATKIADGSVTSAEFQYLGGVTSDIQTQLNTNNTAISDHLTDTTDAHDASAISSVPAGNLAATDVQAALDELQSDVDSRLSLSGGTMTGNIDLDNNALSNVPTPTNADHAANKEYVDSLAAGLDPKSACRVATTADLAATYATTPSNGQFTSAPSTIDAISLNIGDRVLVKDQTDAKENGIYVYTAANELTRSTDMDGSPASEVSAGNYTFIAQGTVNESKGFLILGDGILTLNTDDINWSQFSGATNTALRDLSNLTSPTAINQNLLPDSDLTRTLGDDTHNWSRANIANIHDTSGNPSSSFNGRELYSSNGNTSIQWESRLLRNSSNNLVLDYSGTNPSIQSKKLIDLADAELNTDAVNRQSLNRAVKNYIANHDAILDTTGYAAYADAAATSPVDGTGGSPNITITRSTSSPLRGVGSFLITKDAANRQGQGISYDFTIDSADQGKVLQGSFDYAISSGTYADDGMSIWIYDVTNSRLIQPAPYLLKNHSLPSERMAFEFQTSIDSTSYRLIIHQASTSASAYTIKFDNVSVGPQAKLYGSAVTDWQDAGAISFTNISGTINQKKVKQVGDTAKYNITFTASSAGSGTILVVLDKSIDTSKLAVGSLCGIVKGTDAGVAHYVGMPIVANDTTILIAAHATTDYSTTVPFTWGSGDLIQLDIEVPILGWSSSQIMSSDANTRTIVSRVYKNGSQAVTSGDTKITGFTSYDPTGLWDNANNRFLVRTPGEYDLNLQLNASVTGVRFMPAYTVNGGSKFYFGTLSDGTADRAGGSTTIVNLKAGDYVELFISTSGSATIQQGTTNTFASMSIRQGPSQIAASETIEASYYTSAGPTVDNTAPVVIFGSKEFDDYGIYNTSTGTMTAPISGKWTFIVASVAATQTTAGFSVVPILDPSSGNSKQFGSGKAVTNGGEASAGGSVTVKLLAGETAQIKVYADSSSSLSTANPGERNLLFIRRTGNY